MKNRAKTRKQIKRDVENLLVKLQITEKRNYLPNKLSGGQKRRVCLGMALISDASVCIFLFSLYKQILGLPLYIIISIIYTDFSFG